MNVQEFAALVLDGLPFEPTRQQIELVAALSKYCSAHTPSDSVFLLNGYAGTGKTTVVASLVQQLNRLGIPTVLLASTGRAAKVLGNVTGQTALTIHRKIYRAPAMGVNGVYTSRVTSNPHVNTVFIVDEASMIGDGGDGGSALLEDLIYYVFSGINCRLILLGDTAQLPPVGMTQSPAMDPAVLKDFGLRVWRAVMTATKRQGLRSGILYNATALRRNLKKLPLPEPSLRVTGFDDVRVVMSEELEDALEDSFSTYGEQETILITRSNRRAVDFNRAIRTIIYDREEDLVAGERLIVSKNNYFWTRRAVVEANSGSDAARQVKPLDFVANGEAAVVDEIYGREQIGTMLFADVRLYFPDQESYLDVKLNLDTLISESASLTAEQQQRLAEYALAAAGLDYNSSATAIKTALKNDPYYNALQVKYAYAVTCHKAQGGQWKSVFIDMGYIPPEAYVTEDFYRWLYTATTRATERLSLINPAVPLT